MGMAAKCLQLVNSAFFGLRTPVSNTLHALNLLGLDMLKSLVLSTHIFPSSSPLSSIPGRSPGSGSTASASSLCARAIARIENASPLSIDEPQPPACSTTAENWCSPHALGQEYKMALDMTSQTGIGLVDAEQEVLGCNHAQVGAYLLGLWGLSDGVVEAVAWHIEPSAAPGMGCSRPGIPRSGFSGLAPCTRPVSFTAP